MGKVSIKKNVKPKKVAQKQKQKQIQKVTINIGSQGKKAVTRSRKQPQQLQKQTIKPQPISQPSITSYNQPIFKQPIQQPSSLASSILASQLTPNVVAQEKKEESALNRALQEQITNTSEPERIKNDLEKTKKEVKIPTSVKPTIIPPVTPAISQSQTTETNSIRRALLSQRLDDQGDDTEEISALQSTVPYVLGGAGLLASSAGVIAGSTIYYSVPPIVTLGSSIGSGLLSGAKSLLSQNPLTSPIQPTESNPLTGSYQQPPDDETKEETILEETKEDEFFEIEEPPPEPTILQPPPPEPTILQEQPPEPTILQPEQSEISRLLTDAENSASLLEDLINTNAPTVNFTNDQIEQYKSYTQEVAKKDDETQKSSQSSLLEPSATKSSLTQALQAEEPAQAIIEEIIPAILPKKAQALKLIAQLKKEGYPTLSTNKPNPNTVSGYSSKTIEELTKDINTLTGYETWQPSEPPENRGRPSGTTVATSAK